MNEGGKLGTLTGAALPINFVPVKPRGQVVSEIFINILPHSLQALLVGLCVCDPGGE